MADDETARGARRTGRGAPATVGAAAAAKKTAKKAPAAPAQPTAGAPGKRPAVKKAAAAGKAPAAKKASAVKKAPVVRKAPAAKKAPAAGAAGTAIRRTTARKAAPPSASGSRLAAEQTFDDDWQPPPPPPAREPVREDPNARVRGILRAAAQTVAARERAEAAGTRRAPMPVPERPVVEETEEEPEDLAPPDGPPTQVLIAPGPAPAAVEPEELGIEDMAIDDMELDDDVVEDELPVAEEDEIVEDDVVEEADEDEVVDEAEDGDDWAPPEVIEADEPPPPRRPAATLAEPRPVPPPPPEPSPPPATTPPPATDAPPPWEPPPAKPSGGRAGIGVPLLAIILSILIPLVGAVIGFLLATRARRRGARLAGLARVVAVLAFIAWLIGGGGALYAGRDKGVDYSKLKVGNCFNSSATNQVRGVKVIPCSKSHNSEIFFLVTHPAAKGAPYPGKDQLVQFAADACLGQPLTDYLGIPLEQSKLKDFEIVPQTSAWKDGRRVLVCGLDTGGQGKITGSVKGSRR